jgi:hypothetical protein
MDDVVNLRSTRKQAKRRDAESKADGNRLRFGRSKAERTLEASRNAKTRKDLDRHQIETGEE